MMAPETLFHHASADLAASASLALGDPHDPARIGPVEAVPPRVGSLDAWAAFANPGDVFRHPREVLTHPGLTVSEKRAILATWASDAHTVESCPGLRCLEGCKAEPVPLDAVLDALQALDSAVRSHSALMN